MIRAAEFIKLRALEKGEEQEGISIQDEINQFIEKNGIKELIDIKYIKEMKFDNSDLYILTSVLIVYKK